MELIDRRKLVNDFWKGVEDGSTLSYEDTDDLMENAPTVDAVEVVHGRWIPSDIDIDEYEQCDVKDWYDWECSVCHYQMSYVDPVERRHLTNYCPNCGAKMDGERKDNERKAD